MAAPMDFSFMGLFLPIFAFLLVMVVVYAILQKTKVLGDNPAVSLFISIIMASFFIVEVQLVDFVAFTSSWFVVIIILVFFLFLILAFMPNKENPLEFLQKGNWFSWALLGFMLVFFIISSSFIFNWAINWNVITEFANNEWVGFGLLAVLGALVSIALTKK